MFSFYRIFFFMIVLFATLVVAAPAIPEVDLQQTFSIKNEHTRESEVMGSGQVLSKTEMTEPRTTGGEISNEAPSFLMTRLWKIVFKLLGNAPNREHAKSSNQSIYFRRRVRVVRRRHP